MSSLQKRVRSCTSPTFILNAEVCLLSPQAVHHLPHFCTFIRASTSVLKFIDKTTDFGLLIENETKRLVKNIWPSGIETVTDPQK